MDNLDVYGEDVFMNMFMEFLTDDAREWYKDLPSLSIGSFQDFKRLFRDQYGDHSDPKFVLHELTGIRKNQNEEVAHFNNRFIKLLNKIPLGLKPNDNQNLVFYFDAYDPKIVCVLRSNNPLNLVATFKVAQTIENNRNALGKVS